MLRGGGKFLADLNGTLAANFEHYEIIVVNDCCRPETIAAVKAFAKDNEARAITVLNMGYRQGVERAMNAGIDLAIGDFVFQFDGTDTDWDWNLLMDAYRRALEGHDIVCAVNRRRSSDQALFYRLFNRYADLQHRVEPYAFMLITRRGINRVNSLAKIVPYRNALYASAGLGFSNLYYDYDSTQRPRRERRSFTHLILFSDFGYRVARNLALAMALIVLLIFVYAVVVYFTGNPVEGWTTIMLLMSTSFFGIFAISALIMKYLSVLVSLVFKRQNYVFSSIEKLVNQ